MTLVAECPHDKYGTAIFIRDDLKVKSISAIAVNHVEVITAELPDVVVHSVYTPPRDMRNCRNLTTVQDGRKVQ